MFQILGALAGLASLIPFIVVLVKLFQEKGALHGILGIFCTLYTFIWGWINARRLNLRNMMLLWTGLVIVSAVFGIIGASQLKNANSALPTEVSAE